MSKCSTALKILVGLQCVFMAISTLGQLYRVDKIYSWKKPDYPEYLEKTTDLPPFTDILYKIMLYRLYLAWSLIIYGDTMYHILNIFDCQMYTAGLNTRCTTSIEVSPDTIQSRHSRCRILSFEGGIVCTLGV